MSAGKTLEPVGETGTMPGTEGFTMAVFEAAKVPIGTPLYGPAALTAIEEQAARIAELQAFIDSATATAIQKADAAEDRALKAEGLLEEAVKGLEAEFDHHELLWDLSMDAAREASACGTKANEHEAMRRASGHSKRMDALRQTLTAIRENTDGK